MPHAQHVNLRTFCQPGCGRARCMPSLLASVSRIHKNAPPYGPTVAPATLSAIFLLGVQDVSPLHKAALLTRQMPRTLVCSTSQSSSSPLLEKNAENANEPYPINPTQTLLLLLATCIREPRARFLLRNEPLHRLKPTCQVRTCRMHHGLFTAAQPLRNKGVTAGTCPFLQPPGQAHPPRRRAPRAPS